MTTERAVAHELSHALLLEKAGALKGIVSFITGESRIIKNENKIMDEVDQSPHRDPNDTDLTRRQPNGT
jgi:hypothetical protein